MNPLTASPTLVNYAVVVIVVFIGLGIAVYLLWKAAQKELFEGAPNES